MPARGRVAALARLAVVPPARRRLTQLAWLLVAALYVLVVVGGVVTSSDSGLGCGQHWPLCAGRLLPPATLHGVLEWTHRLVAGLVSMLTVLFAALAWWWAPRVPRPAGVRRLALAMVATLAIQVVLGGLVVLTGIAPWLIALHEGAALLLLDMALTTALWLTLRDAGAPASAGVWGVRAGLWTLAVWAAITSMLGSYLAHLDLSCAGFGACVATMARAGTVVGAGLWHWGAAAVLAAGLIAVLRDLRGLPPRVRAWLWAAVAALGCQALLGILLLGTGGAPVALSLHEAISMAAGAALWGAASTAAILASPCA
jgi:cytochrome c oxidase assembly protein subunit 15